MSTIQSPTPSQSANPVNELLDLASCKAKAQLPDDGRSSARATLSTEVTSYDKPDGPGTIETHNYDAAVALGQSASSKVCFKGKPCACGCTDPGCCCCRGGKAEKH